jgi:CHAD domain-containing protein
MGLMNDPETDAVRTLAHELSGEPGAGTPEENWLRAERELAVTHDYDTSDRDLEQAGVQLSRHPLEAGVVWRLTLPRAERVEIWTTGTEGLAPPGEIATLINGVATGKPLVPAAPLSDDPGARRLREMFLEQRQALLGHEPGVRLGADPENLHKHRVAARHAHAFLRSTRHYVDSDWRHRLSAPLRGLGAATGPVRDLDVLIEHVQGELETLEPRDRAAGASLLTRLEKERERARQALLETLDGDEYRALLARLRLPPRFAQGVESIPLRRIARKEFARLGAHVGRLGERPGEQALHDIRITLKRARYAAELSAPVGKRGRRFFADAKALQDLLGEYQDAVVAEQRLRAATVVDPPTEAAFVAGRLAERQCARRRAVTKRLPAAWKRLRKSGSHLG